MSYITDPFAPAKPDTASEFADFIKKSEELEVKRQFIVQDFGNRLQAFAKQLSRENPDLLVSVKGDEKGAFVEMSSAEDLDNECAGVLFEMNEVRQFSASLPGDPRFTKDFEAFKAVLAPVVDLWKHARFQSICAYVANGELKNYHNGEYVPRITDWMGEQLMSGPGPA